MSYQISADSIGSLDFNKGNGLIPAIIQDEKTNKVLMLGFMNKASLQKTFSHNKVTFFSRSKDRLWTKGESSGNFLELKEAYHDCDKDSLLLKVKPLGPTCHTGMDTCFSENNEDNNFLLELEKVILDRKQNPQEASYTTSLFQKGINKIAQKVGEEAVELVIEAKDDDKELFLGEAADLIYHMLVLLSAKGHGLSDVIDVLKQRHK